MSIPSLQTDGDLERRVTQFLHDRRVPGLRQISVAADCGTVTVRGRVTSFYEKQLCHHICRRVAGVIRLIDEVSVLETQLA